MRNVEYQYKAIVELSKTTHQTTVQGGSAQFTRSTTRAHQLFHFFFNILVCFIWLHRFRSYLIQLNWHCWRFFTLPPGVSVSTVDLEIKCTTWNVVIVTLITILTWAGWTWTRPSYTSLHHPGLWFNSVSTFSCMHFFFLNSIFVKFGQHWTTQVRT